MVTAVCSLPLLMTGMGQHVFPVGGACSPPASCLCVLRIVNLTKITAQRVACLVAPAFTNETPFEVFTG